MADLPATELLPLPADGRRYRSERTVRLGDVDPNGEIRLDAIARYLQDVATDDALDARLENAMGWLVRRTMITLDQPAMLNERVELTTFCTGVGRSWAERRTTIRGHGGASIEGVSLWIQIDVESGRPSRLGGDFEALYGEAADGRQVSSRLSLPKAPPDTAERSAWAFRATDLDPFGHVNNAAQWAVLEHVVQRDALSRCLTGEVEFLAPAPASTELTIIADDQTFWLSGDALVSVMRLSPR